MKRLSDKELLKRKFKKFLYDNDVLEEWTKLFNNKDTRLTDKKRLFNQSPNDWITHSISWGNNIDKWADLANLWIKHIILNNMKELFIKFLKKHGALRKYKVNLKANNNEFDEFINRKGEEDYLDGGFTWSNVKEGHQYWHNLNNKWIKRVEKTK